jgi:hypothetical protein
MPHRRPDLPSLGRRLLGVAALALEIAACARPDARVATPTAPAPETAATAAAAPPELHPGDRWTFQWSIGNRAGTRVAEVIELRPLGGERYYLVRIGDVDHLYTRELHVAGTLRNETVESRLLPPMPLFAWPLTPGRRWEHRGTYEEPGGKREVFDSFAVAGS